MKFDAGDYPLIVKTGVVNAKFDAVWNILVCDVGVTINAFQVVALDYVRFLLHSAAEVRFGTCQLTFEWELLESLPQFVKMWTVSVGGALDTQSPAI